MIKIAVFKDAVKSVLRISSAHNKGAIGHRPNLHLSTPPPELKRTLVYIHFTIANQKSVRYAFSISYFTNIAASLNIYINLHIIEYIPGCDEEHTPQLTIVAVLGFLQEFSSTALTKHFKTGLNQKKRAGICWNKPRNIKYFQISGAISLERLGTTTQPHARALVLSFYGRAVIFSTAKR